MKKTVLKFYLFFLIITLFINSSCESNEIKFDKSKWNEKVDGIYLYREKMATDLIANHLRKGMIYREIVELLGNPEVYSDLGENIIASAIMEDFGWDIDPVETKTLIIELTKDSMVNNYEIMHWKN
jgi:hypothetical protein